MLIFNSLVRHYSCRYYQSKIRSLSTIYSSDSRDIVGNDFVVDREYFQNVLNQKKILENIRFRNLTEDFPQLFQNNLSPNDLAEELIRLAKNLPNSLHPIW